MVKRAHTRHVSPDMSPTCRRHVGRHVGSHSYVGDESTYIYSTILGTVRKVKTCRDMSSTCRHVGMSPGNCRHTTRHINLLLRVEELHCVAGKTCELKKAEACGGHTSPGACMTSACPPSRPSTEAAFFMSATGYDTAKTCIDSSMTS